MNDFPDKYMFSVLTTCNELHGYTTGAYSTDFDDAFSKYLWLVKRLIRWDPPTESTAPFDAAVRTLAEITIKNFSVYIQESVREPLKEKQKKEDPYSEGKLKELRELIEKARAEWPRSKFPWENQDDYWYKMFRVEYDRKACDD